MNSMLLLVLLAMVKLSTQDSEPIWVEPSVCMDGYVLEIDKCCKPVIIPPTGGGRPDEVDIQDVANIPEWRKHYESADVVERKDVLRFTKKPDCHYPRCTKEGSAMGYVWSGGNCCAVYIDAVSETDCYNPNGGPLITPAPGTCKYGYRPDKFEAGKCCQTTWLDHDTCYYMDGRDAVKCLPNYVEYDGRCCEFIHEGPVYTDRCYVPKEWIIEGRSDDSGVTAGIGLVSSTFPVVVGSLLVFVFGHLIL